LHFGERERKGKEAAFASVSVCVKVKRRGSPERGGDTRTVEEEEEEEEERVEREAAGGWISRVRVWITIEKVCRPLHFFP
jgi:hypothetical protein